MTNAAIGGCRAAGEVEIGARAAPEHMVELFVRVTVPDRPDAGEPRAECPSLPFIRRLVDQIGGGTEVSAERETGRITVRCRFPALAAPAPPGAGPVADDNARPE